VILSLKIFVPIFSLFLATAILHSAQPATIHKAVYAGNFDAVKQFIANDHSLVDKQDDDIGNTPLYDAVSTGNTTIICFLLSQGACITQSNHVGDTPVYLARSLVDPTIFNLLQNWPQIWGDYSAARLAFSGALHPKLGAASPANVLPQPLLREILKQFVRPEHFAKPQPYCQSILSPTRRLIHDNQGKIIGTAALTAFYSLIYTCLTDNQNPWYIRAMLTTYEQAFLCGLLWLSKIK